MTDGPEIEGQVAERDAAVRRLAERLGVSPLGADDAVPFLAVVLADGTRYSWEALLHAHLDAMERT
jgi:hypothetical protein